jgi:mannose-6-phosphate isomerase-like protein (cupin superfamily)
MQDQLLLITLEPGQHTPESADALDQVLLVVEGEGEAAVDGKTTRLAAGERLAVRAAARHALRNTASTVLKLCVIRSPGAKPTALHAGETRDAPAESRQVVR